MDYSYASIARTELQAEENPAGVEGEGGVSPVTSRTARGQSCINSRSACGGQTRPRSDNIFTLVTTPSQVKCMQHAAGLVVRT